MRRALFGGSFDPVHWGHLLLAETAREEGDLDEVLFMPAGIPPHKQMARRASGEDRYQMLRAATSGYSGLAVSRFEIDRDAVSYTLRTVQYLRRRWPDDELYLLVGSETLMDIPNWYEAKSLCAEVALLVSHRAGYPEPDFTVLNGLVDSVGQERNRVIAMPEIAISSTLVRSRVRAGRSIRFLVPDSVEAWIQNHDLYREGPCAGPTCQPAECGVRN